MHKKVEAKSSPVQGQPGPRFEALRRTLQRHGGLWSAPLSDSQAHAFAQAMRVVGDGPLVIDAGCGTGRSTARIAELHPGACVLGIDRSEARLAKAPTDTRAHVVLGQLEPFYAQLRARSGGATRPRPVAKSYLLYPNPSPKVGQQSRRLYARPGFGDLLHTSERVEMRTNWEIYAHEFAFAVQQLSERPVQIEAFDLPEDVQALSDFERKYADSGHVLWRVQVEP